MSARSCTARCRKLEPGRTVSCARSARAAKSGWAKSQVTSSSDSSPLDGAGAVRNHDALLKGAPSGPPRFTMFAAVGRASTQA